MATVGGKFRTPTATTIVEVKGSRRRGLVRGRCSYDAADDLLLQRAFGDGGGWLGRCRHRGSRPYPLADELYLPPTVSAQSDAERYGRRCRNPHSPRPAPWQATPVGASPRRWWRPMRLPMAWAWRRELG